MTIRAAPFLNCPDCKTPLFPADGCGYYDREGEYSEHREACECPYCEWVWFDEAEPKECCGVMWRIDVDDDHAYVKEATK